MRLPLYLLTLDFRLLTPNSFNSSFRAGSSTFRGLQVIELELLSIALRQPVDEVGRCVRGDLYAIGEPDRAEQRDDRLDEAAGSIFLGSAERPQQTANSANGATATSALKRRWCGVPMATARP